MSLEQPQLQPPPEREPGLDWAHLRDVPLAILCWLLVIFVVLWAAGHIVSTLIVMAVAVLLSYALSPLVGLLARAVPRLLAIGIVYVLFLATLGGLIYLIVNTAVSQVVPLVTYLAHLVSGKSANPEVNQLLSTLGITPSQLRGLGQQLVGQAQSIVGAVGPILSDVALVLVDVVVITVLSIYFVANGPRVGRWVRVSMPLPYRRQVNFALDTLNHVVGGYIRGQVTLSALVGVLVGFGMEVIFHLPYAILLGVLAFVLEFIPFLGVLASGAACVLVALTLGPLTALLVLGYFVIVHVIEGDVVGPRIVGSAVGLHPAISLIALIAGAELFGLFGAVFAAPVAGLAQALVVAIWRAWREAHPEQFPAGHTVTYDVPIVPVVSRDAKDVSDAQDVTAGLPPPPVAPPVASMPPDGA